MDWLSIFHLYKRLHHSSHPREATGHPAQQPSLLHHACLLTISAIPSNQLRIPPCRCSAHPKPSCLGAGQAKRRKGHIPEFSQDLLTGPTHFRHAQGWPGSHSSCPTTSRFSTGWTRQGFSHLTPEVSSSHSLLLPLPQEPSWLHSSRKIPRREAHYGQLQVGVTLSGLLLQSDSH